MSQKNTCLPGNLKYTIAKAENKEIIIFPTAIPIAITKLLNNIFATGTFTPAKRAVL
jgi:hypothetical protein